jgi:hypothetical protein
MMDGSNSDDCVNQSDKPKDFGTAILAAIAMTLIAYLVHFKIVLDPRFFWLLIFGVFVPAILPTFALYFSVSLSSLYLWRKRSTFAATIFLLTLIPFGHWAYSLFQKHLVWIEDQRRVADIPKTSLARIPATLVSKGVSFGCKSCVDGSIKFQRVITQDGIGWQNSFDQHCDTNSFAIYKEEAPVPDWPAEYLLLQPFQDAKSIDPNAMFADGNGPLELRYIAPGHNDLIAISYEKITRAPATPPVLSLYGWLPDPGLPTWKQNIKNHATFVVDSAIAASEKTAKHH